MPEFKQITENSTQIIGCTSPETAYVVDNYPCGFRLRTQIRYWIETRDGFGQRFCSQTLNPKNGAWNKPKCGTYYAMLVLVKAESNGHVSAEGLSIYSSAEERKDFAAKYQLDKYQQLLIGSK